MCDGFDPATDGWNGGVVLSAYTDSDADGAVDDVTSPIATGTDCSLTFTAPEDGVILLVVNDANCTGALVQNDNGNVSITTDTDCGGGTGAVCGNGVCEAGEDATNCPDDCATTGARCGEFEGGPWIDIRTTSCVAGETVDAGFASWANEAYILDVFANTTYTFSMCDGFDPATDGWNGGVVLSAYVDADGDGLVDDVDAPFVTGTSCSLTFTAAADGVILLVVNDADCTGVLVQNDNGNVSITTDTNCGEANDTGAVCGNGVCEAGEDSANCPGDCPPAAVCGNGICEAGENNANCPGDCDAPEDPRACSSAAGCSAEYGSPSANIPLLTLPPGAISETWEFGGFNTDPGYIFGYILTADLDCNENTTGYNILDFNTTGIFDFSFGGPLSFDGGGIGPGCYGPNAGLYNVFAISYQGTQAELENLIFNVYPTAELLEDAILDGSVCACMPSPGDADQGLYSLFILDTIDCEAEAGEVDNPLGGSTVCTGTGGTFTVGVGGNNGNASSYIQVFVLTDLNFTIIEVSTNGTFSIPAGTGGYIAHSLNVNADESGTLNQNLVGLNVADVFAQLTCYDASPGTGFTSTDVVTVSDQGSLVFSEDYDCNETTGEITVTISISGGAAPYTVSGDVSGVFNEGQNVVITLTEGDNDVSISAYDVSGCTSGFAQAFPACTKTAVELLSFDGRAQANDNLLFWATATEESNSHFNVQRSNDGSTFTTIGKVAGAGNSNVTVNYDYSDRNVDAGTAVYRLEMVDFDGSVEYSNTVTLTRRADFGIVELAPVPAVNLINVAFNSVEEATTRIEVLSVSGKILKAIDVDAVTGINRVQVDLETLTSGIYLISVANGDNLEINKFIKE